jgi:hypothetical protein
VISNWQDSPYDLRRRQLALARPITEVVSRRRSPRRCANCSCSTSTASAWCSQCDPTTIGSSWPATDEDLDELIGFVAVEANHETNRRGQQRLDTALDALTDAAQRHDR